MKNMKINYYILFGLIVIFLVILNYNSFFNFKEANTENKEQIDAIKAKISETEEKLVTSEELDKDIKVSLSTYLDQNERKGTIRKLLQQNTELYNLTIFNSEDKIEEEKQKKKLYSEHAKLIKNSINTISLYLTSFKFQSEVFGIDLIKETQNNMVGDKLSNIGEETSSLTSGITSGLTSSFT